MPVSHGEQMQWMLDRYLELKPEVTVDVGPGCGTYSTAFRPHHKGTWKAIEAWAPYVPQFKLWDKYDHVVVSDLRHADLFSIHHGPDLVIIGDCLEHIPKEEAIIQLQRYKAWADAIMIAVPLGEYPQEPTDSNWFERHWATWEKGEIKELLGDGCKHYSEGDVIGAYLWTV